LRATAERHGGAAVGYVLVAQRQCTLTGRGVEVALRDCALACRVIVRADCNRAGTVRNVRIADSNCARAGSSLADADGDGIGRCGRAGAEADRIAVQAGLDLRDVLAILVDLGLQEIIRSCTKRRFSGERVLKDQIAIASCGGLGVDIGLKSRVGGLIWPTVAASSASVPSANPPTVRPPTFTWLSAVVTLSAPRATEFA
jgi:hypothetical protein